MVALFTVLLSTTLWSQTSFEWLTDAAHPRGLALANSTIAAQLQTDAVGLNPAGLAVMADSSGPVRSVEFGLRLYPVGISQRVIQLVLPSGSQVVALEVRNMNYGDIQGRDIDGQETADYSNGDLLVRAAIARRLGRIITAGATVGGLFSRLEEVEAATLLWSFGLQLAVPRFGLRLGAVAQNQGRILNQYAASPYPDELPTAMLVGAAKTLAHLPLTLFVTAGQLEGVQQPVWRLGGEFALPLGIQFRLGVDEGKADYARGATYADLLSGFSLGLGLVTNRGHRDGRLTIDGAVKNLGPLGLSSAFAVGLEF
jgi:hypothetical protein